MKSIQKFWGICGIVGIVCWLSFFSVQVISQDNCQDQCNDEQEVTLICEDIVSKVSNIFDPIDNKYRNFQDKYSKNVNLLEFLISRLGDLGIENSNMEDILENIDTNNTNLQQLFDTMTRDVQIIKKDCGQTKIDLEVTKIQSDKKNFDELMNLVNTDLRTLKTLIQNT